MNNIIFNSALETGIRTLILLTENNSTIFDLQRLSAYDYLVTHTSDIGGPDSMHPDLPTKNSELAIRREVLKSGLNLLLIKNLIVCEYNDSGISYKANETAYVFTSLLESPYLEDLKVRAKWLNTTFSKMNGDEFLTYMSKITTTMIRDFIEQSYE